MEDLIPVFAIFCTIGLPIMALVFMRLLKHRERMEMIRHGVQPADLRGARRWEAQAAPGPVYAAPAPKSKKNCKHQESDDPPHVALRKGIQLTMIGIALTIGLSFIGLGEHHFRPGPWLLGGLIPMFVGLSQVILALLSGATLEAPQQPWPAQAPPPFGAAPPPSPPPTYEGSYTYRPGDRQELQPPYSPPEQRR